MVISRELNDKLFGGANSVGRRVRWNDNEFRVVGVRDHWMPLPTFYDVNNGASRSRRTCTSRSAGTPRSRSTAPATRTAGSPRTSRPTRIS